MEPLLHFSDRVLLDTSKPVPVPPGIFVIGDGMGILAQRVEGIPNAGPTNLVIESIKPVHQTDRRHAEAAQISGRIIRSGRRL